MAPRLTVVQLPPAAHRIPHGPGSELEANLGFQAPLGRGHAFLRGPGLFAHGLKVPALSGCRGGLPGREVQRRNQRVVCDISASEHGERRAGRGHPGLGLRHPGSGLGAEGLGALAVGLQHQALRHPGLHEAIGFNGLLQGVLGIAQRLFRHLGAEVSLGDGHGHLLAAAALRGPFGIRQVGPRAPGGIQASARIEGLAQGQGRPRSLDGGQDGSVWTAGNRPD